MRTCLFTIALTSLLFACGDDEETKADTPATAESEDEAKSDETEGEEEVEDEAEDPVAAPAARTERTGIDKYRYWSPVPAFMRAPVTSGSAVGGGRAIAVTRDGHVGTTMDQGETWVYTRHVEGWPLAASGYEDGPWVVSGSSGYIALSEDGVAWTTLPRATGQDLVAVAATDVGIVAAGSKGEIVRYEQDGTLASVGTFPDKQRPGAFATNSGGMVYALAGKKTYGSANGDAWVRVDEAPGISKPNYAETRAGICKLGKVTKKKKGVICSVGGTAHGIADNVAAVVKKTTVSVTKDGGKSWSVGALPSKNVLSIFGAAAGPFYAVGSKGTVLSSKDGVEWEDEEWDETESLRAGLVDGKTAIIVGNGGTIVTSKDGGANWDYAEIEFDVDFTYVGKSGSGYITSDGEWAMESSDGLAWVEADMAPEVAEGGEDCDSIPAKGSRCEFEQETTTPEELGAVRTFTFVGDAGIAMGDAGLVALSRDGGATWNATGGLGLGSIGSYSIAKNNVAATDGRSIAVSTDGGNSFAVAEIDAKKPSIYFVFVNEAGQGVAGGRSGALYVSSGDLTEWSPVDTGKKNRTTYVKAFDVGGVLYVTGSKGELWRSTDGSEFSAVSPGFRNQVQAMAGNGDTVFAMTLDDRYSYRSTPQNFLMVSDDGGERFHVAAAPSDGGRVSRFEMRGSDLVRDGEISNDRGRTWRPLDEKRWSAEKLPDMDKWAYVRRGDAGAIVIAGEEKEDYVQLDNVFAAGASLQCYSDTGCWLAAGGTIYRPAP